MTEALSAYTEAEYAAKLAEEVALQRARREARRLLDAEDRIAAEIPDPLTLRERLALPREPVKFRIEGWQPADSRVVLAAQFKAGKTTLVGNLVRGLVDGGLFLGRDLVHPIAGAVTLLDFEMSAHQITAWLADQKIVADDRVRVLPLRGRASVFDILDQQRRAEWAERLRQWDTAYLVLDCLRPVLDSLGLDENRDAGRFLVAFDELLKAAGVPEAFIVHHMGHMGERSRGDSRIRDWPDVEWRLVRQDEEAGSPRFISAYGRDIDVPEAQLCFEPTTRHLGLVGGNRRDALAHGALDAVVVLLLVEPGLSGAATEKRIMEQTNHKQAAIRAALKVGVQMGRLTVVDGARGARLYTVSGSPARQLVETPLTDSSHLVSSSIDDEVKTSGGGEQKPTRSTLPLKGGPPPMPQYPPRGEL